MSTITTKGSARVHQGREICVSMMTLHVTCSNGDIPDEATKSGGSRSLRQVCSTDKTKKPGPGTLSRASYDIDKELVIADSKAGLLRAFRLYNPSRLRPLRRKFETEHHSSP